MVDDCSLSITSEQYSNFMLGPLIFMIKKNIYYTQIKGKIFWEFIICCSISAINVISILPYLGNNFTNWTMQEYKEQKLKRIKVLFRQICQSLNINFVFENLFNIITDSEIISFIIDVNKWFKLIL